MLCEKLHRITVTQSLGISGWRLSTWERAPSSGILPKGVRKVKKNPGPLTVEEAVKISDMPREEELEICILKTHELLSEAQLLMTDIQELLDLCASTGPSNQRRGRTIQQECQAIIEEDGETLVIEGFRFESGASREDLKKLSSQACEGGRQRNTRLMTN